MLGGDVLVLEPGGLVLGALDHARHALVEREAAAADLGTPREGGAQVQGHPIRVGAEPAQRQDGGAVGVLEQRGEQVLGVEHGALRLGCQALGGDDRLLRLLGVSVELHRLRMIAKLPIPLSSML